MGVSVTHVRRLCTCQGGGIHLVYKLMRYLDLADALRARIVARDLGPGGALAGEMELAREYGTSRVTVRRALDVLRQEGLVTSRRGAGWFAAVDPVRQPLGRVTTVEAAVEAAGGVPRGRGPPLWGRRGTAQRRGR